MKLFKSIKNWFHNKYVALFELITLKVMLYANKLLRKLIILKGKDPDYVAPPPPPPKQELVGFDHEKAARTLNKFFDHQQRTWVNGNEWVKAPAKHPVLQARQQFEAKQANKQQIPEPQPPELSPEEWLEVAGRVASTGDDK